tara:strand:- start:1193 stop:1678 length:486 start_codon:yes stop_codon:yes gene_type:complete
MEMYRSIGTESKPATGSRNNAIDHFPARAFFAVLATGLLSILSPANAAETDPAASEAERWSVLVTFGEDDCPESTQGEIVVCAHQPEEERYRIPKAVREREKEVEAHYAMSWTAQFQNHEDDARLGRPNSCSPVGTNGFTGCQAAFLRDWFAERTVDSVKK